MTTLQLTDIEALANSLRGNWQEFPCFIWTTESEILDPDNWCIYYTHNRDSGLLDQSNKDAIATLLEPYKTGDDIYTEDHNHWACGWVAGYSVRVYCLDWDGISEDKYTPAFLELAKIIHKLQDYPVLNDDDYSAKELDATFENITSEGRRLIKDDCSNDDWVSDVYHYLSENDYAELESLDDRGAYPSENALATALHSLDLLDEDYLHLVED